MSCRIVCRSFVYFLYCFVFVKFFNCLYVVVSICSFLRVVMFSVRLCFVLFNFLIFVVIDVIFCFVLIVCVWIVLILWKSCVSLVCVDCMCLRFEFGLYVCVDLRVLILVESLYWCFLRFWEIWLIEEMVDGCEKRRLRWLIGL